MELGVIEKTDIAYGLPIVLIIKHDKTFQCCVDYRKLNQVIEFCAEPDPDLIFTKLSTSWYFTKIDISHGFWQIKIKESDHHILAFIMLIGNHPGE